MLSTQGTDMHNKEEAIDSLKQINLLITTAVLQKRRLSKTEFDKYVTNFNFLVDHLEGEEE